MDITFCSVCNESIPVADLERGRAVHRGNGVVCAACETAMDRPAALGPVGAIAPEAVAPSSKPWAAPQPVPNSAQDTARSTAGGGRLGAGLAMAALAGLGAAWFVLDGRLQALQSHARATQLKVAQLEPLRGEMARQADEARSRAREDRDAARRGEEAAARLVVELQGQLADARDALQALARRADEADQLRARLQALEPLEPRVQDIESRLRALVDERAILLRRIDDLGRGLAAAKVPGIPSAEPPAPPSAPPRPAWEGRLTDLKNSNESVRLEAVFFLAESHDPAVVPHLVPMLRDENLFVRTATARALRDLKTKEGEALIALCEALLDEKAPVREAAWVALRSCTGLDVAFDPMGSDADRSRRARAWRDAVEGGLRSKPGSPGAGQPPAQPPAGG